MRSLELTSAVTALANVLAANLTLDEMALLASILVQLGDTLATIAARENLYRHRTCFPRAHVLPRMNWTL